MSDPEPEPDSTIIAIYIIAIVLLILLSAFFSATETAYTSVNKPRLKTRAGDGNKRGLAVASRVCDRAENEVKVGVGIDTRRSARFQKP